MNGTRVGYRGYIASRPVRGVSTPQRVQNLVIRDYAARHGLHYLLSMAEYAMPGSFMMFENLLAELERIEGVIAFSAFMLPPERDRRLAFYRRILDAGGSFHAALENSALRSRDDVEPFEDLIGSVLLLDRVPFGGRYVKTPRALAEEGDDPFVRALGCGAAVRPHVVSEDSPRRA